MFGHKESKICCFTQEHARASNHSKKQCTASCAAEQIMLLCSNLSACHCEEAFMVENGCTIEHHPQGMCVGGGGGGESMAGGQDVASFMSDL